MKNNYLVIGISGVIALALVVIAYLLITSNDVNVEMQELKSTEKDNEKTKDDETNEVETINNDNDQSKKMSVIKIPSIKFGVEPNIYDPIVIFRTVEIPYTIEVLNATLVELFKQAGMQYSDGYFNPIDPNWGLFKFNKATLNNGHAKIYFTGGPLVMSNFEKLFLTKPIEEVVFQFDSVKEASFYLNDKPFDLCIFNEKLGCVTEAFEPWHVTKKN